MTLIYWGDFGYDYVYAFTEAVESYRKNTEGTYPDAFSYCGTSLKHAVERSLYFTYVSSPRLVTLYDSMRRGFISTTYVFEDELEYIIAKELVRNFYKTNYSETIPSVVIRNTKGWRVIRYAASNVFKAFKASLRKRSIIDYKDKVLVYVIHEKFVRFFMPITDNYPGKYVYIHMANPELKNFIRVMNLPSAELFITIRQKKNLTSESHLVRFPWLLVLFDTLYKNFSESKPNLVLVPEGNAPDYEVINQVCSTLGIPVVCIQNGWAPYIHNGFRNLSFTKMLVWGEGFVELLKPYNPQQEFVVTGSYLIKKNKDSMTLTSNNIKKGVGFFLQAPSQLISNECWSNFLELIRWTSKEFPEISIYIREHPSHNITEAERTSFTIFPNVILANPSDWKLERFFRHTKVSVAVHSSTILESIAAGVLPVIYNETPMPRYFPDVDAQHAAIEVKTLAKAKDMLSKLLNETIPVDDYKDSMRTFSDKFFYCDGQDALNSIINEIERTFNEKKA